MRRLFFGFDLSLNSTGVFFTVYDEWTPESMGFYNLIFDDQSRVNDWVPIQVPNVDRDTYTLPRSITAAHMMTEDHDENDFQSSYDYNNLTATLKAMNAVTKLALFVKRCIEKFNPDIIYINVEGYVNPSFMSRRQASTVQELSIMQGLFRAEIIKLRLLLNKDIRMKFTAPNVLKKFFTGDGKADKKAMIKVFMNEWGCKRFIPEKTEQKIDDIVDAFALNVNMIYSIVRQDI